MLEPGRTSTMELLPVNHFFIKNSIVDVQLGFKYTSTLQVKLTARHF